MYPGNTRRGALCESHSQLLQKARKSRELPAGTNQLFSQDFDGVLRLPARPAAAAVWRGGRGGRGGRGWARRRAACSELARVASINERPPGRAGFIPLSRCHFFPIISLQNYGTIISVAATFPPINLFKIMAPTLPALYSKARLLGGHSQHSNAPACALSCVQRWSRISPHSPGCAPGCASGTCGGEHAYDKVALCSQRVRQDCAIYTAPMRSVCVCCVQTAVSCANEEDGRDGATHTRSRATTGTGPITTGAGAVPGQAPGPAPDHHRYRFRYHRCRYRSRCRYRTGGLDASPMRASAPPPAASIVPCHVVRSTP
jgi:hypothetical protein